MKNTISKIIAISIITILISLIGMNFNIVRAEEYSYSTSLSSTKTTLKPGETFNVSFKISNINMGEDGMHAIEGRISYEKEFFETVNIENADWNVTYNETSGRFVGINLGENGELSTVFTATFKVKDSISNTTSTTIAITDITSSAAEELINGDSKSIDVKIDVPEIEDTNKEQNNNTNVQENSNNASQSSIQAGANDATTAKKTIPTAGLGTFLAVAIFVLAIVLVALIIKQRLMKDIK